jgi:hypothetical protein
VAAGFNKDMTCFTSTSEDATIVTKLIDLNYFKESSKLRIQQIIEVEKSKNKRKTSEEEALEEEEGDEEEEQIDYHEQMIANLEPEYPELTGGLSEVFFIDDVERVDAPVRPIE